MRHRPPKRKKKSEQHSTASIPFFVNVSWEKRRAWCETPLGRENGSRGDGRHARMGASKAAIRFSRGDSQHCFRALLLCSAPPALLATSREEQDGSSPGTPRRPRGQRGGARREGRASFLCSFSVVLSRGGRVERGKRPRERGGEKESESEQLCCRRFFFASSHSPPPSPRERKRPSTSVVPRHG